MSAPPTVPKPPTAPPMAPPVPPTQARPAAQAPASNLMARLKSGAATEPQGILLYGRGGIGKTSLVEGLKRVGINACIVDPDRGSGALDVDRIGTVEDPIKDFNDLMSILRADDFWRGRDMVVIDSATKVEEMAIDHILATKKIVDQKTREVTTAQNVSDFPFGTGYQHVFDLWLEFLSVLDSHLLAGRHVLLIAHENTVEISNPEGGNYLTFQPRFRIASKACNIGAKTHEWANHTFFIGYDSTVKDGKVQGSGSRTIHTRERGPYVAKTRSLTLPETITYRKGDVTLWEQLFGKK